ncbi:sugar phosphate isomerase/epimerase family protein [Salmonirosea aquatica]|uniref:TIM barrel protein n=1 Tax=Salmonirosea aquatica TaxID=2654236 RepID=A0A7C9FQS9_9BACT|nr:TIM barrel protein [Cytophagaceae bacterium SJW1-29]
MRSNRRQFLNSALALTTTASLSSLQHVSAKKLHFPISCNQYTWFTFFNREGREWGANLDASLAEYVKSGFQAFEPSFTNLEEVIKLGPLLKKYNLALPSFYVNSTLHRADEAQKSIDTVLAIAKAAQPLGAKIVVTNPSPIRWGGPENKNDAELTEQARNLDRLGAALRKIGMTLSYHTHDIELRAGAREFHHMLLATDPENVTFCMDVHWVYRGSGNSELAVFDVLKLYGERITELHLRQSKNGVWLETFQPEGDIDYPRLVQELKNKGVTPHLVVEQCLEEKSPHVLTTVEAHQRDLAAVKQTFRALI